MKDGALGILTNIVEEHKQKKTIKSPSVIKKVQKTLDHLKSRDPNV